MTKPTFRTPSKGLLNFNLDKADNILRLLSGNSPLIKMALLGTGAYFAGKAATPIIARLASPKLLPGDIGYDDMHPADQRYLKRNVGFTAAAIAALPTLIHNIDFKKKGWGLSQFPEKDSYNQFKDNIFKWFNKQSNAFNMMDPMQSIPLSMAKETIIGHSALTPMTKATSLSILNTFPEHSQVDSKSIIDRAVSSGIDFMVGGAAGAVTAHALGLPNPYTTAIITGALNTII
jgi:hypothetical protein